MFQGHSIRVGAPVAGIVELCFDRQGDAINKLDRRTVSELRQAITVIAENRAVRGVLITSAKEGFIVGADITEFESLFRQAEPELMATNLASTRVLSALEDLPVPTAAAINGFALGGGLEAALAADFRVMCTSAQVGLPEVKLGLFPGFGGTVRLPRVANVKVAIDWITSGAPATSDAARAAGVVDAVTEPSALRETARALLAQAIVGKVNWRERRAAKLRPVAASAEALAALFAEARKTIAARVSRHQPAALACVEMLDGAVHQDREQALMAEARAFARIAKTQAAAALVQSFLSEQLVKKKSKSYASGARRLQRAAVLGAGIMGGGIAYTSAARGTPVLMKDIKEQQLTLGLGEARKLLDKQVTSGRLTQERADAVLASIVPQLDYSGFEHVDIVVEAVVENLTIKQAVLGEIEARVEPQTVIASNTSSLRIDELAASLARPENFIGMHFFNPVPVMPLVEVVRGARSSDAAVATVVAYALALGKTPIVVKDGPGFLVNRILTPYMQAFGRLLADGADFVQIDRAMEAFGWPMGPAYLNDVVGMDTGMHVAEIICAGFPQRLSRTWKDPLSVMVAHGRLGQKNGVGFYRYSAEPGGKPKRQVTPETYDVLKGLQLSGARQFSAGEIVERMMLPMIIEAVVCLEEGVVGSAAELDMALLLGVGFPPHLGGALKYADWLGLDEVVTAAGRHAHLGPQYAVTPRMRELAAARQKYY